MFGCHTLLRCANLLFLIPYVAGEQSKTQLKGCLRSGVENHAEFIEHVHSFLDMSPVGSIKVHDSMACTLHCIRNEQCYSVNFAIDFDDQGHDCDLLPSDKYYSPNKFQQNVDSFHHYSIASPCENDPCEKGAKCLPLYRSNGFLCKGFRRKIERAAPWIKVAENICFGAKDNSYAKFTVPWSGAVLSVKLLHVSGYVKCQLNKYGSYWGCHQATQFTTLITNQNNAVIFPDYNRNAYSLPGYHTNSTEVVFRVLKPPVRVADGEEFRIWHRQDLLDSSEANNGGKTCTDVYILIA